VTCGVQLAEKSSQRKKLISLFVYGSLIDLNWACWHLHLTWISHLSIHVYIQTCSFYQLCKFCPSSCFI